MWHAALTANSPLAAPGRVTVEAEKVAKFSEQGCGVFGLGCEEAAQASGSYNREGGAGGAAPGQAGRRAQRDGARSFLDPSRSCTPEGQDMQISWPLRILHAKGQAT